MSEDVVLSVRNASKAYRIWQTPASRIVAPAQEWFADLLPRNSRFARWVRARAGAKYRDFYALRDLSLEVHRGESVGIVGRNGSGKSTLLQLIAGTSRPSSGTAATHGRIAALLELGSGFNPEFTGRENVYLNGSVLGLTRQQIDARYDAIVSFSEIGEFIDQPVKTYSSGMVVRLAFAVAAHVDPDILIIDEALAVGDARFQLKCARAIDRFVAQGVTLLFVSHDLSSVKRLCNRAILLEQGRLVFAGEPNDVTNLYSKLITEGNTVDSLAGDIATLTARKNLPAPTPNRHHNLDTTVTRPLIKSGAQPTETEHEALRLRIKALETVLRAHDDTNLARKADALLRDERSRVQVTGSEFSYGGTLGEIVEFHTADAEGQLRTWFTTGETVVVQFRVSAKEEFHEPIFALTLKNASGVEVYGTNTLFSKQPAPPIRPSEEQLVTFAFPINLMPGTYFVSLGFTHFVGEEIVVIHRRYDAIKLEVHGIDRAFGIANLNARIHVQPASIAVAK